MRHRIKGRKFGRSLSHRKAMLMNLAKSLILHDRIQTTLAKAKDLRPYVEKLLTIAKTDTLANRRYLLSVFCSDEVVVNRLITVVAPRALTRNGGYTRILKNGFRKGDNSPIGLIEFVDAVIKLKKVEKEDNEKEQTQQIDDNSELTQEKVV